MGNTHTERIDVVFVCGGDWHDFDFARLEILKLLAEDQRFRTTVYGCYDEAVEALNGADFVISYTSNRVGSDSTQEALRLFIEQGGKWFALHGTNSLIVIDKKGQERASETLVHAPRAAPTLMTTLGSQFVAHPPIGPYTVEVTKPDDPLVRGLESFQVSDELYLMETHGDLEVLLHSNFTGEAPGFAESEWDVSEHPIMYRRKLGKGSVLYLTLGHCRGHYDMNGITDFYPAVERGAWELPVFYELLRRGLRWAIN